MEFLLPCECGKNLMVTDGMAGTSVQCGCGRLTSIPSLGELRKLAPVKPQAEAMVPGRSAVAQAVLWIVGSVVFGGILLGGAILAFNAGGLPGAIYLVAMVGHVWLVLLVARECPPDAVFYALVIPFFVWYFAYQRWDIAKWPFILSAGGGFLSGLAASWGA